jgi:DNA-binding MarR family transcriptional regulator
MAQRSDIIEQLTRAIYENSTAAVFFHTAIAEQVGLGATEEKTLLILSGGALTAGEIAQKTGLTTGSVTSLIDRLEKKGFVRRVRDGQDRRKVIVEVVPDKLAELGKVFGALPEVFNALLDDYSDDQLQLITGFIDRLTERAHASITRLAQTGTIDTGV